MAELEIYPIELEISAIELEISAIELEISANELQISFQNYFFRNQRKTLIHNMRVRHGRCWKMQIIECRRSI